jgi:hypothetical protein
MLHSDIHTTWLETSRVVQVQIIGHFAGDHFRQAMCQGLKLVEEKQARGWLADLLQLRITSLEDQNWLIKEWYPLAAAAGIKYSAIVMPEGTLGQMSVNRVHTMLDLDITISHFNTIDAALHWLNFSITKTP